MTAYQRRVVDDELNELMPGLPAIALEGARAVGKTRTARERASTMLDLDDPGVRDVVAADVAAALGAARPVVVDEWQRIPHIWDHVRREVDNGAASGSFLLTGSTEPPVWPAHSGAGRIVSIRMRPLSLHERLPEGDRVRLSDLASGRRARLDGHTSVGLADYVEEIVRSGFPGMRRLPPRAMRAQIASYVDSLINRDFPEFGHAVRRPDTLRRWMAAYAAATSTVTSFEKIRDAAGAGHTEAPAKTTVIVYRDILERLYVLDALPAWAPSRNHITQLSLPPKHHLVDPALAVSLLGLSANDLSQGRGPHHAPQPGGAFLGALFESLVTQSVRVYAQQMEARVGHMRTKGGRQEVDLIMECLGGGIIAMEVKLNPVVDDATVRHLYWLTERMGDEMLDAIVVTTGNTAYRRSDGIAVVPAAMLCP